MEEYAYNCINHIKYVSKKIPTYEKILPNISKLDIYNPDADN